MTLYEENLTTYYLYYYICSNEICRTLNLSYSPSNVVDLRSLWSLFYSVVDHAYLNDINRELLS